MNNMKEKDHIDEEDVFVPIKKGWIIRLVELAKSTKEPSDLNFLLGYIASAEELLK